MSVRQCCGSRVLRHAFPQSAINPLGCKAAQHLVWQLRLFVSVCKHRLMKRGKVKRYSVSDLEYADGLY